MGLVLALLTGCAAGRPPECKDATVVAPHASPAPFFLGADISSAPERTTRYVDVDGRSKGILELLAHHGFNAIRLRTFVEPGAPHGYASRANGCPGLAEPFGDREHVLAFAKEVKAAGMSLLLDFHYSDVWADPSKQIIPEEWRDASSVEELARRLKLYTKETLVLAIAQGARPDMVQVGNEITSGMLKHLPGPATDCWGNYPVEAPLNGGIARWNDLAVLLRAAIDGVREVDPSIEVMLHIDMPETTDGAMWWIDNARSRGVKFDALGLSVYTTRHGTPDRWATVLEQLAAKYDDLDFVVAEYGQERTKTNLMVKGLPERRGLGTFIWEPTRGGDWGHSLFIDEGAVLRADPAAFAEYDALLAKLGLRP